jgi:hypothetical protein
LGELVQVDALSKQNRVKGNSTIGAPTISSTMSFVKKLSEELVVGVGPIGVTGGAKTETLLDGGGQ